MHDLWQIRAERRKADPVDAFGAQVREDPR